MATNEQHRAGFETTRGAAADVQLAMRVDVGEAGAFMGMASVQGSVANGAKGPVIFKPGAFRETLADRGGVFPLLWQHEDAQPIGKVTLTETSEGLVAHGQITQNARGREITELLRDAVPLGLSIGFNPIHEAYEKHASTGGMIRCVSKAKLKETSIVTFPADPAATIRVVHSAVEPLVAANAESDDQIFVSDIVNQLVGDEGVEVHAGRVFSEKNLTRMRATAETLLDLIHMADTDFAPGVLPKYRTEPDEVGGPPEETAEEGCDCDPDCECEGDCGGDCPDCEYEEESGELESPKTGLTLADVNAFLETLGEGPGHPFRGNQYDSGENGASGSAKKSEMPSFRDRIAGRSINESPAQTQDRVGHPFRGNQYDRAGGSSVPSTPGATRSVIDSKSGHPTDVRTLKYVHATPEERAKMDKDESDLKKKLIKPDFASMRHVVEPRVTGSDRNGDTSTDFVVDKKTGETVREATDDDKAKNWEAGNVFTFGGGDAKERIPKGANIEKRDAAVAARRKASDDYAKAQMAKTPEQREKEVKARRDEVVGRIKASSDAGQKAAAKSALRELDEIDGVWNGGKRMKPSHTLESALGKSSGHAFKPGPHDGSPFSASQLSDYNKRKPGARKMLKSKGTPGHAFRAAALGKHFNREIFEKTMEAVLSEAEAYMGPVNKLSTGESLAK